MFKFSLEKKQTLHLPVNLLLLQVSSLCSTTSSSNFSGQYQQQKQTSKQLITVTHALPVWCFEKIESFIIYEWSFLT